MAAFVSSNSATGTVSISVALTGVSAGNGLLIFIGYAATAGVTSPAISGETVVALGTNSNDPVLTMNLHGFYVTNVQTGGTKTFTATVAGDFSVIIMEISGQDTTDMYVSASAAFAASSGGSHTVNVVTGADGQFVIGFGNLHGAIPTAGSGYTMPATNMPIFGTENWKAQYDTDFTSGVAGTKTFNMGNTGTNFWAIKGYAFKPGAGGGGVTSVQSERETRGIARGLSRGAMAKITDNLWKRERGLWIRNPDLVFSLTEG